MSASEYAQFSRPWRSLCGSALDGKVDQTRTKIHNRDFQDKESYAEWVFVAAVN